eukprot:85250-Chlamydomonas_euryale.AAC.1
MVACRVSAYEDQSVGFVVASGSGGGRTRVDLPRPPRCERVREQRRRRITSRRHAPPRHAARRRRARAARQLLRNVQAVQLAKVLAVRRRSAVQIQLPPSCR